MVEKLKNAYQDLTPGSAIAQQTRSIVTQSEEILNAWVDVATDAVVNYNLQDGQKNNTPGGVQYSIRNTSRMGWEEQLKAFRNSKMLSSDSFFLGETPAAYGPEFEGNPLVMNQKDYRKSKSEKHNVPNRVLKKIPELLSKPIMTFTQGDRLAVVLNEIDGDGKPLVAALHANEQMDRQSVTAVTSIYGVDNWVQWLGHQAEKEIKVFDKERANRYLQTYGSNASVEDAIRSTGDSLSDRAKNVNPEDTLYSSRNVQQTKNLVALHNITEDKFLKTLKLGGFPMPDTASQKLLQELDSRGIPHQTYQAGNEEQRHQMVQDMEDIRFSQRSAAQLERENAQLRRDKEYLKGLVKIQRQGNKDVVPTRASVIKQAEELKKGQLSLLVNQRRTFRRMPAGRRRSRIPCRICLPAF